MSHVESIVLTISNNLTLKHSHSQRWNFDSWNGLSASFTCAAGDVTEVDDSEDVLEMSDEEDWWSDINWFQLMSTHCQ